MICRALVPLLAAGLVAAAALPGAAASSDPDWPCIQVRNPQIAATAIWGGPELPEGAREWWTEQDVADAVRAIASRRTAMDEVEKIVARIAEAPGDRPMRLAKLFTGMLERINTERDRVMNGLVRYARKQRAYANRIEKVGDQIEAIKAGRKLADVRTEDLPKLEEELKWEVRIFDERSQSLTYVCETPGFLEQRAFDIARLIAEKI